MNSLINVHCTFMRSCRKNSEREIAGPNGKSLYEFGKYYEIFFQPLKRRVNLYSQHQCIGRNMLQIQRKTFFLT
jgi:hypothetical protein